MGSEQVGTGPVGGRGTVSENGSEQSAVTSREDSMRMGMEKVGGMGIEESAGMSNEECSCPGTGEDFGKGREESAGLIKE